MKALILAAGLGTRLEPITKDRPKSLVPVNGKPILFKQIESLQENGIRDIIIISGYKADILEQEVRKKWKDIQIVESKDYAITNNMYSAFVGRDLVKNSEFLMMNADVYFDSSVIKALLKDNAPNAIVTDIGRYIEESMKVVEKGGRLTSISKKISPNEALGSSIDVYKFSNTGGAAFFEKCREYIEDKKEYRMWSEVALNDILQQVVFKASKIEGRWVEIDNHEDLAEAEKMFRD